MYAIFEDGSHQYRVRVGDQLQIDLRACEPDDVLEFPRVLMLTGGEKGAIVGSPVVEGARVEAKVVKNIKGPKLFIQFFRRRKNARRRTGHRQKYTLVQISNVVAPV